MTLIELVKDEINYLRKKYESRDIGYLTYEKQTNRLYDMLERTTEVASQTVRVGEQCDENGLVQSKDNT